MNLKRAKLCNARRGNMKKRISTRTIVIACYAFTLIIGLEFIGVWLASFFLLGGINWVAFAVALLFLMLAVALRIALG